MPDFWKSSIIACFQHQISSQHAPPGMWELTGFTKGRLINSVSGLKVTRVPAPCYFKDLLQIINEEEVCWVAVFFFSDIAVLCCLWQMTILHCFYWNLRPRTTTYTSSPTKAHSFFFAEATKFNNLEFNCCNCFFLTICHYCAPCKFKHLGQQNVNWTNCSVAAALKTTYGPLPLPRVPRAGLELNTRQSHRDPWWQHTLASLYLTEPKRESVQLNNGLEFYCVPSSVLFICHFNSWLKKYTNKLHHTATMLHRLQLHKCQKMRQLLLFACLLEKISLSRGGLGHLPPRWQRDVIGNLVRGLTQMLGRSWGQARQGATRNGSQLQRCRRWVCTDMVGCESPATPSISASLCGRMKQSRRNG